MAQRGRPRKVKPEKPKRPRGRPPKPKEPPKPNGRPAGLYGEDVLSVVKMEPDRMIRFRYTTEKETQSKYRCMRRAVAQLGLDRIVHKNGHTVEVVS